jgi:tRNA A-37 threonylcarbamoyl transferase component Bud32
LAPDSAFTFAHTDYYEPLELADPGRRYRPTIPPLGWTSRDTGVWTQWSPPAGGLPEQGWKVHVSAALAGAQHVLDVVSAAAEDFGVPFKHLAGTTFFLMLHGPDADRTRSGKFCALYPPTEDVAGELLRRLARDLADVTGPRVLTDRRFGSSRCVSYRYGAFLSRSRLEADGTRTSMVLGPDGVEVPEERRPEFRLPPGIVDPFVPAQAGGADDLPTGLPGWSADSVLRHTNSGGAYVGHGPDGRQVFIRQARAHNGYTDEATDARLRLQREYHTLCTVHASAPGLCPEPLAFFTHHDHAYLITELVPGRDLARWAAATSPVLRIQPTEAELAAYYHRCHAVLGAIDEQLARLHALGYAFGELAAGNVLIDDASQVRLIDFESARRLADRPSDTGAVARMLLFPKARTSGRSPESLDHLHADLAELAPVPGALWRATKLIARTSTMPSPEDVRADPMASLRWLRDRTADALEAMAEPDNPRWIYPTTPDGHRTNTRCLAHGTAGVLHALRFAGRPVAPVVLNRLRDMSLRELDDTPPGLLFGTAGIAWTLGDLGAHDAANDLLAAAFRHPLATTSATLGGGTAGIALALMASYCRTGQRHHLDWAVRLLTDLPKGDALAAMISRHHTAGLVHGRSGIALALYYLARLTGDRTLLKRGLRLLREELALASPIATDALGFRASTSDDDARPYLCSGSAGYVHVLARYLTMSDVPELSGVLRRCLRALTGRFTVSAGLFQGLSGLGMVLGEAAGLLDRDDLAAQEIAVGTGLFKHAVPHETGIRWLGDNGSRFSAELWTGSAGVLLAVSRLLTNAPDPLFTIDGYLPADDGITVRTVGSSRIPPVGSGLAVLS